ncbi:hypothetical protein MPER_07817, partial [Moniliophthora perniciosa FA553]
MTFQPIASSTFHFPASAVPESNSAQLARQQPLPTTSFYSVEYPGYVRESAVPIAIQNLGGPSSLETALRRGASKSESVVELKLRPDNPFAHAVPGEVVPTNSIVLKVTRRKRKRVANESNAGNGDVSQVVGEYKAEPIGVLSKTVRFRSMVDFQLQPDTNNPISELRSAMDNMDVDKLRSYKIPPEKEDYIVPSETSMPAGTNDSGMEMDIDPQLIAEDERARAANNTGEQQEQLTPVPMKSNLRLFPPPLFSRQTISQAYNYKSNPASMESTIIDEQTGEEKKRLINRMRWK